MNDTPILLVDDELAIVRLLETVLRKEGFGSIDAARSAEEALAACERRSYGVIVLDVALPGMSGIEACPFIRRLTDAPILFLSARTTDFDKLTGFAVGGDDYVTKPFNPLEIVARIKSLLRRSRAPVAAAEPLAEDKSLDYGRFRINEAAAELLVEGEVVPCPPLVYQLLLFLSKNPTGYLRKASSTKGCGETTALGTTTRSWSISIG